MAASAASHALSARVTLATAPRASARRVAARRALTPRASADSAQLGTAKLPPTVDEAVFVRSMFQWANGLTTSGQNLPFALPQRVDALETGFSMAFLQSDPNGEPGTFVSVGEIVASCLLYTSPSPRDGLLSRMPSSA